MTPTASARTHLHKSVGLLLPAVLLLVLCLSFVREAQAQAGAEGAQPAGPDIAGGRPAAPDAWPWQVALVYRLIPDAYNGYFCSGALIAPDWVLTSAACLGGREATMIDALVGARLLSANQPRIQVDRVLLHPSYPSYGMRDSVGLLHLSQPVTQTTIALFDPTVDGAELDYLRGTLTGWGNTNVSPISGPPPDALQEVGLPLVDPEICRRQWEMGAGDQWLCAGYPQMTKAACYGDQGGPFMLQKPDGSWRQAGIILSSPQDVCNGQWRYTVLARVGSHREWILACVQNPAGPDCSGTDAYEPDDTAAAATLYATLGVSQTHTFHQPGDMDWVAFDVQQGAIYTIRTSTWYTTVNGISTIGSVNTLAWLYDDEGRTPLAYNDTGPLSKSIWFGGEYIDDSQLVWRARRDGRLYLSIENLPINSYAATPYGAGARYQLMIARTDPQLYLSALWGPAPAP